MKVINSIATVVAVLTLAPQMSEAANRYVRPGATGANSGSDWTNAYTSLPASLVRGDTYYLADGSYGSVTFDDANSGTTVITIKKAISADHGSDTGWASDFGDGQAVFRSWNIHTDYYVFDGQRRNADWRVGGTSQYGIKVAGTGPLRLDNGGGTGADNVTFRFVDIQGGGRDTGSGDDVIYGLTGNTNITFQFCALRDSDRTIFLMRGNWTNLLVDHSYLARNTSTDAIHGELLSSTSTTNMIFSHNSIEDIEGTAVWASLNGGTSNGWKIFGNTITHTPNYLSNRNMRAGSGHGVAATIYVANDASNNNTANNVLFYNNTIINLRGLWSGLHIEAGTGNKATNNIWYNSPRLGSSGTTHTHNWYYNTGPQDGDDSATKVICTSACDKFVSIPSRDFRLASGTPEGTALPSPYNVDPDGATRGDDGIWDRGAFDFGSQVASTPNPPSGLTAQ